jgi:RNA polymerase sigma factor (sigma-70 family)
MTTQLHADRRTLAKHMAYERSACEPALKPIAAGRALTAQDVDDLWAAYVANRADLRLRNRLVEHYFPWFHGLARSIARRMRFRDRENAVGEMLAALVKHIVPSYDGHSGFERWARLCTRQKLVRQMRVEQIVETPFSDVPRAADGVAVLEMVFAREQPLCDLNFLELAAGLSDLQAAVLWLRYYRGLSIHEVAGLLRTSPAGVKSAVHHASKRLRKQWSEYGRDELPAH